MHSSFKVLIVDDHKLSQKVMAGQLEAIGFESIQSVSSAKEALSLLESDKYDIVIFDFMMPEIDGLVFLKECKRQGYTKDTAFMLATADADERNLMNILTEGAISYINKPIFQEELSDKINNVIMWLEKK